jgi:redox-sensitive bicupin YhaK (pirin superfamily)
MADTATIDIRRSGERPNTAAGWLDSHHSFSFGQHYDPANTHHGLLLVNNDDWVRAGTGFSTHPHRDMEIITWVLEGELEHKDTTGHQGIIYPGLAQRMSAGRGIWHSEMNPSGAQDVHFVQMWVLPDTESVDPSYQQLDINPNLDRGGLVPVASGRGHDAAIAIRQESAVLWAGHLQPGETVPVPDARHVHLFVARGDAELEGAGHLAEGDAVRLTGAGHPALTAGPGGAEVLVWETG